METPYRCYVNYINLHGQTIPLARDTGEIVDSDIEINAIGFAWADLDITPADGFTQDLQNALTRELGHVAGLAPTCSGDASQPRSVDENDNPIPDCDTAPELVRETTMFPSTQPGDVSRRTLTPDDQRGLCAIYPLASDPMSCLDGGGEPADAAVGDGTIDDGTDAPSDGAAPDSSGDDGPPTGATPEKPTGRVGGCGCRAAATDFGGRTTAVAPGALVLLFAIIRRSRGARD